MSDTTQRFFTDSLREELAYRRVVVLDGALDEDNGPALMSRLLALAADDARTDISFWIHSPGGSVPAMVALRDIIRTVPCDVRTLVLGWAASAGQFILSAGTPGKRFALPNSKVLMHQGSSGIGGTAVDVELQAEDLRNTRDAVLGMTAEDTGQPVEKIFDDSLRDRWYSAKAAQEYGFFDHIVTDFWDVAPLAARTRTALVSQTSTGFSQNTSQGGPL